MQNLWYLIYCKPRQELLAQQHLQNQGFDTYLPLIQSLKKPIKKTATSNEQATEPLFPRYIFAKANNNENLGKIRSTRGVAAIVKFGSQLATVSDDFIQQLLRQQIQLQQHIQQQLAEQQNLQPGDPLNILSGPFASLNAIFQTTDGNTRSLILLNFLGQQLQLSIDNNNIKKLT